MPRIKVYVAGKVSRNSSFGTHHWRDEFCNTLENASGRKLTSLDPAKAKIDLLNPDQVFAVDCKLIQQADLVIVYLSDDISVGGSQEILIAKYLKRPVIGFAPYGGKFNGSRKEYFGQVIENFKDPFVFSTCDFVCGTVEEVAAVIETAIKTPPKTLDIIDRAIKL